MSALSDCPPETAANICKLIEDVKKAFVQGELTGLIILPLTADGIPWAFSPARRTFSSRNWKSPRPGWYWCRLIESGGRASSQRSPRLFIPPGERRMNSEMVERVAKAIWGARWPKSAYDKLSELLKDWMRKQARAAIEAIDTLLDE